MQDADYEEKVIKLLLNKPGFENGTQLFQDEGKEDKHYGRHTLNKTVKREALEGNMLASIEKFEEAPKPDSEEDIRSRIQSRL